MYLGKSDYIGSQKASIHFADVSGSNPPIPSPLPGMHSHSYSGMSPWE